jgi:hypothetical protein
MSMLILLITIVLGVDDDNFQKIPAVFSRNFILPWIVILREAMELGT